ncbi:MAG: hypothetical protein JEZ11_19990 [Desulfobacterales bacterium]|nr:hypothetical protein [Desulfobacterales bacterium]
MPDKSIHSNRQVSCGFKPHCFPNIPLEKESGDASVAGGRSDGFQCFQSDSLPGDGRGSTTHAAKEQAAMEAQARDCEQAAHARGYAEGEKAGMDLGRQSLDPVMTQMRQTLVELEKLKKRLVSDAEAEAVALALAISRKIVRQEIATDPQVVLNTVRAALEKVVERDRIRIRLNPQDLEAARDAFGQFSQLTDGMESVSFDADASISPGGCLVETQFGDIDGRIDHQMEWLEETFINEINKAAKTGQGKGP